MTNYAADTASLRLGSAGTGVWVKPTAYPSTNWVVIFNKGSWGAGQMYIVRIIQVTRTFVLMSKMLLPTDTFCANTYTL
jgi:hypothetical protein